MGSEMEAGLWRATADFYNANLRNVSGPYDRSYGMDMQSYVSVVGLCLRTVLDESHAPLPNLDHPPVDHVADLYFIPELVVLDTKIPSDAMKSFHALQGEHQVRRQIPMSESPPRGSERTSFTAERLPVIQKGWMRKANSIR